MTSNPTTDDGSDVATGSGEVLELLRPDALTALMRATWTWDDRALRRDLADVLVAARASDLFTTSPWAGTPVHRWHDGYVMSLASTFVRSVLGSHLVTRDLAGSEAYVALARLSVTPGDATSGREVVGAFTSGQDRRATVSGTTRLAGDAGGAYMAALEAPHGTGRALADIALTRGVLGAMEDGSADRAFSGLVEEDQPTTVAVAERLGTWDPALVRTRAEVEEGRVRLTGEKRVVPFLEGSRAVFVLGRTTAGPTLYRVDLPADGASVSTAAGAEDATPFSTLRLDRVAGEQIGTEGSGGRTMARLLDRATVVLAGELVGHGERSIEALVARDPDDPALPHLVAHWASATVLWWHAIHATDPDADSGVAAGMAHIAAGRVARSATGHAVGVAPAGGPEYVRRDRVDAVDLLFGGPAASHERLLERLDI